MTVFQIDLQYVYQTEYWTNKFYVNVGNYGEAESASQDIVDILKGAVQNSVTIEKARIRDLPFVANAYVEVIYNTVGTGGSTEPAPLFNVVRWDWSKGLGRAIHQYFRGGVTPSNIGANQQFTSAAQTFNQSIVAALLDMTAPLCDHTGATYQSGQANPRVGMHQLRRGSKRVHTPVI
jgi:hypothetical protein